MRLEWTKKTSIFALAFILTACGQAMDKTNAQTISEQNLQKGQAFLSETAKVPGVSVLPSGVMYKIVSRAPAPGAQPTISDTVKINYEGKLLNGKVFDSSYARNESVEFPLGRLIPAWQEVIPLLHVGDEMTLYTPPSSGYGERDSGKIPPNSTLIFRIQLLGVQGK